MKQMLSESLLDAEGGMLDALSIWIKPWVLTG